jgi:hypothetical protein
MLIYFYELDHPACLLPGRLQGRFKIGYLDVHSVVSNGGEIAK